MPRDGFPAGVAEQLKWYVYRLIDPRNGETFYVGKGRDNRVFSHAKGQLTGEEEEVSDPKLQRVKEINAAGLEVAHVIHQHGLDTAKAAYQVEAALIDAYPGLTNKVRGHGAKDYGSQHVEEIIAEYAGEEFEVKEPLLLISIGVFYYQRGPYDAVRFAWRLNRRRLNNYNLVLASLRGVIVGAYRPTKWLAATRENFPGLADGDMDGYLGFVGKDAEQEVWDYYVRKRVPERYRKRGARNPRRYCHPDDAQSAVKPADSTGIDDSHKP